MPSSAMTSPKRYQVTCSKWSRLRGVASEDKRGGVREGERLRVERMKESVFREGKQWFVYKGVLG